MSTNNEALMKIFLNVVLVVLVLLAASSGIAKIMLMKQEVDFFSPYGFSAPILIAFGSIQLIGALLLTISKTRIIACLILSITFLISAVALLMSGNIPMAAITFVFIVLVLLIVKQSLNVKKP